ncbi:hypothetical protein [Flavobacterium sp.]|uniref:hypothetical protein n=1 Tax=Flavobacterium sp. TaxID=239 RepID=UPI002609FA6A|nr:hypothetical protein [Flavobacterium sp.]
MTRVRSCSDGHHLIVEAITKGTPSVAHHYFNGFQSPENGQCYRSFVSPILWASIEVTT